MDTADPDKEAIRAAAEVVRRGGTVVFPTETVYGLGANALSGEACLKIFAAKDRPADNPLIVHISDLSQLKMICRDIPEQVYRATQKFWPGPLTVILPKTEAVPSEVSGGLGTVAVRMPAHPVALSLIKESGVPIAAPSANLSTKPSPTRAEHAVEDLWGKVDLVLDAGETLFGVESTIIQPFDTGVRILRPGPYTQEELKTIFSSVEVSAYALGEKADKALAPGMKYKHYAPTKPLLMASSAETLVMISRELLKKGFIHTVLCSSETAKLVHTQKIVLGSQENLYDVAKNLFHSLRVFDRNQTPFGLVQPFTERGIGLAIMNRLRKSCGGKTVTTVGEFLDQVSVNFVETRQD